MGSWSTRCAIIWRGGTGVGGPLFVTRNRARRAPDRCALSEPGGHELGLSRLVRGSPQIAAWAGHSVAVLLRVYASCLDGQESDAKARIKTALRVGEAVLDGELGHVRDTDGRGEPVLAGHSRTEQTSP